MDYAPSGSAQEEPPWWAFLLMSHIKIRPRWSPAAKPTRVASATVTLAL